MKVTCSVNVLSPLKGTTLQSWKINTTNFTSVYNPVFAETYSTAFENMSSKEIY